MDILALDSISLAPVFFFQLTCGSFGDGHGKDKVFGGYSFVTWNQRMEDYCMLYCVWSMKYGVTEYASTRVIDNRETNPPSIEQGR